MDRQWVNDPEDLRIALVVGNSDYYGYRDDLDNPVNDAQSVYSKLEKMGYSVDVLLNGNSVEIRDAMDEFVMKSRNAKVSLFFFAGHGVQILSKDGSSLRNQLLPIDYAGSENGANEKNESRMIDLADFVARLENSGTETRIIILDACRNIPSRLKDSEDQHKGENTELDNLDRQVAVTKLLRNPKFRTVRLRNGGDTIAKSGFSEMNNKLGTLVVYSTGTGKVAPDSIENSRNSPFTTALLKHIDDPDQKVGDVLNNVKAEVAKLNYSSRLRQTPVVFNVLDRDIFLVARLQQEKFNKLMQSYLRSRGCYTGSIDGKWGSRSSNGLSRFKEMSSLSIKSNKIDMRTLNAIRNYLSTSPVDEFCQPGTPSPGTGITPVRIRPVDECTRRAQRFCANPDNSSAIGYQACMVSAKKGCSG